MEQHLSVIDVGEPPVIGEDGGGFDYGSLGLTDEEADKIRDRCTNVLMLYRAGNVAAVMIGDELANIRDTVGHGHYERIVKDEFPFSLATAHRLRQVAETFREISHVERFEQSALYELSGNKVSDDLRDQFIDLAESGQLVRAKDVREAIKRKSESSNDSSNSTRNDESKERPDDHRQEPDPTDIEIMAEIVRLVRWLDRREASGDLLTQEIEASDDPEDTADLLAGLGDACLKAVESFEGR